MVDQAYSSDCTRSHGSDRNRLHLAFLAGLLAMALSAPDARASLQSQDGEFGPGTITLDTDTGLQWLDITVTTNRTFDDIEAQLGPGGEFEGYRHATTDEIMTLWEHGNIPIILTGDGPPTGADFHAENLAPVTALMDLIGYTINSGALKLNEGFSSTAPDSNPDERIVGELNICISVPLCVSQQITPNTAMASLGPHRELTNEPDSRIGHYLVVVAPADDDGDGLNNNEDNCVAVANADQHDTDADGIGNVCDGDFDQDCNTSFEDLAVMKANFFLTGDLVTDMNVSGVTNFGDLGLLKGMFFGPPGPSGVPNVCDEARRAKR